MPSLGSGSGRRGLSGGKGEGGHKRRSICGPINEESETEDSPRAPPTTRLADFDHLSVYKRHHRPRPVLPRSSSAPNLLDILLSDHPIFLNHHPPPSPTLQKHPPSPRLPSSLRSQQQMANLLPTSSINPRARGTSHFDFKTATTGVIGKSVRNELSNLVSTVKDAQTKKASSKSSPC
jgi:UTP--glucose-1-phosphate uridylyltransferase